MSQHAALLRSHHANVLQSPLLISMPTRTLQDGLLDADQPGCNLFPGASMSVCNHCIILCYAGRVPTPAATPVLQGVPNRVQYLRVTVMITVMRASGSQHWACRHGVTFAALSVTVSGLLQRAVLQTQHHHAGDATQLMHPCSTGASPRAGGERLWCLQRLCVHLCPIAPATPEWSRCIDLLPRAGAHAILRSDAH